ncbi:hypothetical protein EYZ11_011449 [Aspergillus tanneri]|uniref:Xylanolytic transcriptional activator regulatory domain-containing protein n=1 Tax=Aspergillus tanneri TaxID=1220188 RepID=A0A4S3J3E4_9EURO|nr:hypothetical protein EYZ11_011449 [Aspergillus tanneri]
MVKKQGIVRRAKDTVQYPTRPSRAYVEELERRLESMEQQLQQPKEPSIHGSDSESVDHDSEHSQSEGVMDQASYVINAQDGRMRFFGPSSGFAFASQQGAHWPTGGSRISIWHSAVQRSASRWQLGTWFPRPLQDDLQRRVFQPLPENRVVRQLVTEFFSTFNQAIPLFNESSFARALDRQFSWSPDESSSWWASLNVVLAFAYAQRAQESDNAPEWQLSLGHIKNTLNVIVDLFMRTADLFAVQAMLGLAIYFQGTPNPQSLFMFAAAAMRLSQSIGLHRAHALRMTTHQTEERRRTYWLAFILDADISLRVGRPPVQDSNDYDTPLPAEEPVDGKGILIVDSTPVNFFRLLVQFALIQRRVYHHLYTSAVQNKTRDSIVAEVKACEDALLDWKHAIPTNLQPQSTFSTATAYPMYHLLRLHLTFHCCYGNLYQVGMHAGRPASILSARNIPPVEDEIAQTMVASLESARSAVRLIKYIKRFGSAHQW